MTNFAYGNYCMVRNSPDTDRAWMDVETKRRCYLARKGGWEK